MELSLREQHKLLTRERFLASAQEAFERKGYSATTIDDIVAGAGASRATFYLHFRSKTHLFLELAGDWRASINELFQGLDDILADRKKSELRTWLARAVIWFREHRLLHAAFEEAIAVEPEAVGRGGFMEVIADSLPRYLSQMPQDKRKRVQIRIDLLLVMMARQTFAGSVLDDPTPRDEREVMDTLATLWLYEDDDGAAPASEV